MDLVGTSSRLYRAPGEPGHHHHHQQAQRWFNTSDITAAHQNSLLKQLNQQRHQERFCDCSVLVEGTVFRAHRNVLFASSGYFRMLLSSDQLAGGEGGGLDGHVAAATASFDAFSPETFAVILDFIYSGQLELSGHNVIEVMSAASYLQMNNVISYCKNFIKSSLDISVKEEEEERCVSLPEVCGFTPPPGGDVVEDVSDQQQQQRPPCPSVSPPPALWTHDNSSRPHTRSQPGFLLKDPDGEAPSLEMKVESNSPARDLSRDEDDMHDPHDPLFTLPGPERRRGRGASKRRASPYSSRSSSAAARREALEIEEARAQKAEKAEELYATLPTILGFIGNYNKDANSSMRFKCPFCTHTVKRKADLKRHLRCHTGERPYPCQACNKRFTRLEHLRSHVETIHQARKLVCRKCKCPVTEETGHVVCEGTRRYRMCTTCIQEVGCDSMPGVDGLDGELGGDEGPALLLGVDGEEEGGTGDTQRSWMMGTDGDDDLAEDSGADLIIQEVDDSDVELQ